MFVIFLYPAPTLVVQTSPSTLRILDVSPYNHFIVSCSARAELEGENVLLTIIMDWIVRKKKRSLLPSFSAVPSTEYRTVGSPDDGYLSILNTTETDTVSTTSYRCRAKLAVNKIDIIRMMYKDTAVKVMGML